MINFIKKLYFRIKRFFNKKDRPQKDKPLFPPVVFGTSEYWYNSNTEDPLNGIFHSDYEEARLAYLSFLSKQLSTSLTDANTSNSSNTVIKNNKSTKPKLTKKQLRIKTLKGHKDK